MPYKFSIGLRSGEQAGQSKMLICWSARQTLASRLEHIGSASCCYTQFSLECCKKNGSKCRSNAKVSATLPWKESADSIMTELSPKFSPWIIIWTLSWGRASNVHIGPVSAMRRNSTHTVQTGMQTVHTGDVRRLLVAIFVKHSESESWLPAR